MALNPVRVRSFGTLEYGSTLLKMQQFTETRTAATVDEIWMLQHTPVYTLGLNGHREHILRPGEIPVVQTDRGGQATYHGPGQLIIYPLLDIKRIQLGVRGLVSTLELCSIQTLAQYGIRACSRADAPGVYVDGRKIASVGLRIRRGCSYHGMSLNVSLDLEPFDGINICGFESLQATRLSDLGGPRACYEVAIPLVSLLVGALESEWVE